MFYATTVVCYDCKLVC